MSGISCKSNWTKGADPKNVLAEMTKTARSMLAEKEITVEDAVLEMLVSDDAEKTKATVNAFAKAFRSAVETAVKEKLRALHPKEAHLAAV